MSYFVTNNDDKKSEKDITKCWSTDNDGHIIGLDKVGDVLNGRNCDINNNSQSFKYVVSPWNNPKYKPDYDIKSW